MSPRDASEQADWHPLAAVCAWALPGLGHAVMGETRRAAILAVTIGVLWLAGVLIGGAGVLDRTDHPAWFIAQMNLAPSVIGDAAVRGSLRKASIGAPAAPGTYQPSFGHTHEQGLLFTSLAGLLNLLAILDVAYRDRHHRSVVGAERAGEASP